MSRQARCTVRYRTPSRTRLLRIKTAWRVRVGEGDDFLIDRRSAAFEYSISGKWLELLKEFVPALGRAAVVREPSAVSGIDQFAAIQAFASSSGLELTAIDPHEENAIDPAFAALARQPNAGVIVTASSSAVAHRDLLIAAAMRYRLQSIRFLTTRQREVSPPTVPIRR